MVAGRCKESRYGWWVHTAVLIQSHSPTVAVTRRCTNTQTLRLVIRLVIRLVKELRVRYLQVRVQVDLVGALRVHTCSTSLTGQTALGTGTVDQVGGCCVRLTSTTAQVMLYYYNLFFKH